MPCPKCAHLTLGSGEHITAQSTLSALNSDIPESCTLPPSPEGPPWLEALCKEELPHPQRCSEDKRSLCGAQI